MRNNGMTIGINGSMLDHQPSGIGIYSINLINHLFLLYQAENNHPLTVFTPSRFLLNPALKILKLGDLLQSSRYGKLAAISRFIWNTFIYPFRARNYDVLLSPTTHASFISRNQILTIHDLLSLRFGNINAHQRLYFKYLLPFLVNQATLIIAVSEATKRDIVHFLDYPADKIKVIYNGYDKLKYNTSDYGGKEIFKNYGLSNYFLVVGPTYPHKNIELLIQAYSELPDALKIKHAMGSAGGKRPYIDNIKCLVHKLGLEKEINFLGYVPQQFMAPLYKEAFALIFPSLYEGFGFPLLEAMACGCPVITSNTSSMPEVCGDAAFYINPLEKMAMIDAMTSLENDPGLYTSLKKKGLLQAKKFSWEKTAAEMKVFIETYFNHPNN